MNSGLLSAQCQCHPALCTTQGKPLSFPAQARDCTAQGRLQWQTPIMASILPAFGFCIHIQAVPSISKVITFT